MSIDQQEGMGKRQVNTLMFLICIAYFFDYADRMVMASLLPYIKADWNCSDSQLGMLTSIVNLFIAIFVLPLSVLVDKWSRTKMAALMIFFWSVSTLFSAFALTYNQLLFTRALTGIGEAAYAPASVALITMMYPLAKRARYIGFWNAFAPFGAAVGFIIGGTIGMLYGWRHALGVLAVPGIILSVFLWFAKDYKTVGEASSSSGIAGTFSSVWKSVKEILGKPVLLLIFMAYALNMAINSAVLTWFPSYLNRYFDMDKHVAGKFSGVLALLTLIGAPLGGYLADKWFKKNKKARLLLPAITSAVATSFLLAALLTNHFQIAMTLFIVFGLFTMMYLAPATAAVQDVVHPGVRALAFGLNVVFMNFCGAFWAPVFVGFLSDHYGLHNAMYVLPVFGLAAALLFYLAIGSYLNRINQE